jgi:hypothetical protein
MAEEQERLKRDATQKSLAEEARKAAKKKRA